MGKREERDWKEDVNGLGRSHPDKDVENSAALSHYPHTSFFSPLPHLPWQLPSGGHRSNGCCCPSPTISNSHLVVILFQKCPLSRGGASVV